MKMSGSACWKVVMMASDAAEHYRQFLAGLILAVIAGTATIWWAIGFLHSVFYFTGAASVMVFTYAAPTYHPDIETDPKPEEQERGFR